MTALNTQATARVTRTRPWPIRQRFTMELIIGGINTGLHWHLTKKETKTMPSVAVRNAAQLLEHYGLMDETYAKVSILQTLEDQGVEVNKEQPIERAAFFANLPPAPDLGFTLNKGSKVELVADLGSFKAGQIGTVTRVDHDDLSFPIRVALQTMGAQTVEIPMKLSEVKAVSL
jgi:hypothetical protein